MPNPGEVYLRRVRGRRYTPGGAVLLPIFPAWVLESRRAARTYLYTTTFAKGESVDRGDPLLSGIRDAADECRHGNLPPATCDCW